MTSVIDWEQINYFTKDEFVDDVSLIQPEVIYALDEYRNALNQRIFSSPVKGSMVRLTGNPQSQHYAVGRLSTAIDIFCEGFPIVNFLCILQLKKFTAVGIYLDTIGPDGQPWIMFHVDMRKREPTQPILLWITEKLGNNRINVYRYPQSESQYWSLLRDARLYTAKYKNKTTPTIT